jgi:transposase
VLDERTSSPPDLQSPLERIAQLEARLAQVTAERDKLRRAYALLQEQLELLRRRIFLAKAERVDVRQLEIEFAETHTKLQALARELGDDVAAPPAPADPPPPAKPRPKPTGRRDLKAIDMPEERIELLDPAREGQVERIGFEESCRVLYRRGGFVRCVVARATYKTEGTSEPYPGSQPVIITVPKPKELVERGILAPSAIAHILCQKYRWGMPFHRLAKKLASDGFELDDGTMCRYAEHVGASLGCIVQACTKEANETAFCLSTDATGVCVQPEPQAGKRQPCRKGHFFVVLADKDHVFFEFQTKHTSAAVCEMFRGFSGYVQADAHAIYDAIFRGEARVREDDPPPKEVGCWSHCRRRAWEAAVVAKDPAAREALLRMRALFELEAQWADLAPAQRHARRQLASRPLVDDFFAWAAEQYERFKGTRGLPAAAFGYAVRQQAALRRFLDDGRLPLTSRVGGRRGGVQAALGRIRRFQLRARVGFAIAPSPAPATSNRTGGFPASGSPRGCHHVGVMSPSRSAPLSRDVGSNGPGNRRIDPKSRTPSRYSTASTRDPFASISSPQTA